MSDDELENLLTTTPLNYMRSGEMNRYRLISEMLKTRLRYRELNLSGSQKGQMPNFTSCLKPCQS